MALVNYRETLHRFSHIDGEVVRASTTMTADGGNAEVVVRFYPWWEHPLYVAARERGDTWGFSSYEPGKREVVVKAIRPRTVRLSVRANVTDWAFATEHPLLWGFAERSTIYVNAPFDPDDLLNGLIEKRLPYVSRDDLIPFVHQHARGAAPQGMTLPSQLHGPFLDALRDLKVPVFAPRTPSAPASGVVFLLDDGDHVIADDFELDVPEFVHEPSWFQHPGS